MREITDIPGSRVKQVIRDFELAGCSNIEKIAQKDGKWTVRAYCMSK